MKMLWSILGLSVVVVGVIGLYQTVMRVREIHTIPIVCCGAKTEMKIIQSQRRFFGSHHFGWGGGNHSTRMEWEHMDGIWEKQGRWWPIFAIREQNGILLGVKQYLVKPPHFEIFRYEKNQWESVKASELGHDAEKLRQASEPFLEKMNPDDRVASLAWLDAILASSPYPGR